MVVMVVLPPPQAGTEMARLASSRASVRAKADLEIVVPCGVVLALRSRIRVPTAITEASPASHHAEGGQLLVGGIFGQRGPDTELAVVVTVTVIGAVAMPRPTDAEPGVTLHVAAAGAPVQASETLPVRLPAEPTESL